MESALDGSTSAGTDSIACSRILTSRFFGPRPLRLRTFLGTCEPSSGTVLRGEDEAFTSVAAAFRFGVSCETECFECDAESMMLESVFDLPGFRDRGSDGVDDGGVDDVSETFFGG